MRLLWHPNYSIWKTGVAGTLRLQPHRQTSGTLFEKSLIFDLEQLLPGGMFPFNGWAEGPRFQGSAVLPVFRRNAGLRPSR
jgi:hypothetical protein